MMGGSGRKDFATELLDKIRHNINAEEVKEMEADGGIDLNELETIFAQGGLKLSTTTHHFTDFFTILIIIQST